MPMQDVHSIHWIVTLHSSGMQEHQTVLLLEIIFTVCVMVSVDLKSLAYAEECLRRGTQTFIYSQISIRTSR